MVSRHHLRRAKFEREIRCRLGEHINTETELISFCSAVTRPVFAWSSIEMLATLLRPRSLIWIPRVIGPVTCGMCGCEASPRVNSTATALKDLINRKKAIASTHTSCFWILLQEHLLASKIGIFQPPVATIRQAA